METDSARVSAHVCAIAFRSTSVRSSPCKADHGTEDRPEQTSRVDPDRPFERRAGPASHLQPAGKCSVSPLLFHT